MEEETNTTGEQQVLTLSGSDGSISAFDCSSIVAGPGLILSGSCWGSGAGVITVNPEYAMRSALEVTVDKHFKERSYDFKQSAKNLFRSKTEDECLNCLLNMFTHSSLEFMADMNDDELLNFLRVTC